MDSDEFGFQISAKPRPVHPAPVDMPAGESFHILLRTDPFTAETTLVTPLGGDRFQLEWTPISSENARLGSIARLRYVDEDEFEVVEILEHTYDTEGAIIPRVFADSPALQEFGAWVESKGGRWECVMRGQLIVHMPIGRPFEWIEELNRRIKENA